jgi:hypothetical protein
MNANAKITGTDPMKSRYGQRFGNLISALYSNHHISNSTQKLTAKALHRSQDEKLKALCWNLQTNGAYLPSQSAKKPRGMLLPARSRQNERHI